MPIALVASLIAFQILLAFVHLATYATLSAAFGFDGMATRLVFVLLSLTFVTASLLAHWSRNRLAQWYYAFSAYWFGLVHFLFMGGVAFFVALNISNAFMVYENPALLGGICFGVFFLIHLYGTWNSGRAQIVRIKIPLTNLPEYWKDRTLVFVSDVHLGAIHGTAFTRKVALKIGDEKPAAIFIGGDLYDGVKCDAEKIIEPLKAWKPEHGVHYITGNHEYYGDFERYMAAIRALGIRILDNEKIEIEGIQVVGLAYRDTHKRDDLIKILSGIKIESAKPSILLKHEPDNLDVAEGAGFSAGFFGHTHQGQIWPLSYITRQMYQGFDYGLKPFKKMQVYTSSGVGTWGPPLRLGTKSEIVVVSFAVK